MGFTNTFIQTQPEKVAKLFATAPAWLSLNKCIKIYTQNSHLQNPSVTADPVHEQS